MPQLFARQRSAPRGSPNGTRLVAVVGRRDHSFVAVLDMSAGVLQAVHSIARSVFLLEHGMLDAVIPRRDLKPYLVRALDFMRT